MPPGDPVPDPGIGQLAMLSEAAQAWVGTAPGAGGPGRAGLPVTSLGCGAAACCCEDDTDATVMTPASANTPAATTYHRQCRRLPPSPAVPMMSGSGLPSPSGRKGNIRDHPYANISPGEPTNEGQRRAREELHSQRTTTILGRLAERRHLR